LDEFAGSGNQIVKVANNDLDDPEFVNNAVRDALQELVPYTNIPSSWFFRIEKTDNGFYALNNFDYTHLNQEYHKLVPEEHSTLNDAFLINHILEARIDLQISAYYVAEAMTTPVSSNIIKRKLSSVIEKRTKNTEIIANFQDVVLHDAKALREVINSGERTFSEFIDLLDKASHYKSWLRSVNPDENLLREYFQRAAGSTWVQRLPTKSLRFVIASAVGFVHPIAGVALGAGDMLVGDKLARGWRPHQFVNRQLKKFTSPENSSGDMRRVAGAV
jgi:hypothetical protein